MCMHMCVCVCVSIKKRKIKELGEAKKYFFKHNIRREDITDEEMLHITSIS